MKLLGGGVQLGRDKRLLFGTHFPRPRGKALALPVHMQKQKRRTLTVSSPVSKRSVRQVSQSEISVDEANAESASHESQKVSPLIAVLNSQHASRARSELRSIFLH